MEGRKSGLNGFSHCIYCYETAKARYGWLHGAMVVHRLDCQSIRTMRESRRINMLLNTVTRRIPLSRLCDISGVDGRADPNGYLETDLSPPQPGGGDRHHEMQFRRAQLGNVWEHML